MWVRDILLSNVGERSFGRAVEDPVLAPVVMEHQNEMMEFHNEKKK